MSTQSTIQASIDSLNAEIERLTTARDTMAGLLDTDDSSEQVATPEPSKSKSSSRKTSASKGSSTKDEPRRRTNRKSAKASTNGKGGTRKDQILAMLNQGMSPREIADELGIATNYVYNTKRNANA